MKKFIKYSLIGIVGIVVLCVIALVLMVTLVNPNRFKPFIEKAVYQSTGRNITLDGDISWKLYPNLGIKLKQVSLSNPTGFDTKNFVNVNSADVSVALLPLFEHRIIIKTLDLDGLNLALIKQNGKNNWSFTAPQESSPSQKEATSEKPQGLKLELSSFSFNDATVSYDDFDTQKHYALNKVKLTVDTGFSGKVQVDQAQELVELKKVNLNYNDQILAQLNFTIQNFNNPTYSGDVQVSKLLANQLIKQFKLSSAKPLALLDNLSFNGHLDGDKNNLKVNNFKFNLNDTLKGETNLKVTNLANPSYQGTLSLDSFNLNHLLDGLGIAVNARKNKPLLNNITIKSDGFNGDKNNIAFNNLQLGFADKLKLIFAKLSVGNFTQPTLAGSVSLPNFNLRNVLDELGMDKIASNKPLFNNFALNTQFRATASAAEFNTLSFSFGNNLRGSANLSVNNFSKPTFSGNFNLPAFSLNQVMAQLGESVPKLANSKWLNSFAINSSLSGSMNALNLQNLQIRVSNTNVSGNLNISSITPLAIGENILIDSLDVADITDINGFRVPLHQIQLSGNSSFSAGGKGTKLAYLNGKQNVRVGNVTVKGISLDKLILDLNKTINSAGQNNDNVVNILINATNVASTIDSMKKKVTNVIKPGNKDYTQSTNLGSLVLNTTINHGVVNPSSFRLSGPSVDVAGNGSVNLVSKALSYRATGKLLVNGINPVFKALAFPIILSGTTSNPTASLDWSSIEQQLLRYAINQNKSQIQGAIKQGINQAVGDQLKKSLGNQNGNKATDDISKGITNAIDNIFGGSK